MGSSLMITESTLDSRRESDGERMPHVKNPLDEVRIYFEDSEGTGPPVLFYTGFGDPLEVAKSSGLARALSGEFRMIFADHRGQGGSDKPLEASAYGLATRVADAVAVLDTLDIARAHFLGSSWGARLGYALGEHAPERLLSLVLCGNQPYAWNLEPPTARAVAAAIAASRQGGMKGFVETFEAALDYRFRNLRGRGPSRRTTPPPSRRLGDPLGPRAPSLRTSANGGLRA
jgi:pimeloyl-ACP methyl ester carboxylesterase